MKNFLVVLAAVCLSWTQQRDSYVEIYRVSFTCPAGWDVKKAEDDGEFKTLSIEKAGDLSSGIVSMLFTDNPLDLDAFLQLLTSFLEGRKDINNLVLKAKERTRYGKYDGLASSYSFYLNGVKHEGEISVFLENGITMGIIHQEVVQHHSENLKGFETIKGSLTLKD